MTSGTPTQLDRSTQLSPSYRIPLALVAIAISLVWIQIWVGVGVGLFGVFLLFQAITLRLVFTTTALEVRRGETLIRCFPYQDWQNWQIFWPRLPILFYFKEFKSIHFLPILFNAQQLRTCLEQYCPIRQSTAKV